MTSKGTHNEDTPQVLQEQAEATLSRVMSMDRGPFKDKMKGDPFEYEILGDPCAKPPEITFRVIGFSSKASPGYRGRHGGKIGTRVLEKGKFIFPKTAKYRKLKLDGKDSWEILAIKTLGGFDLICDRVTKAEEKEKKAEPAKKAEKKADTPAGTGERTAGKPAEPPKKTTSGAKKGTLKYWVENDETGIIDSDTGKDFVKVGKGEAKKILAQAFKDFIKKKANSEIHNLSTLAYALNKLEDDFTGFVADSPIPSTRLEAALYLVNKGNLETQHAREHNELHTIRAEKEKLGGAKEIKRWAQDNGANKLANYLGMPFFRATVSEALHITPQQFNQIILRELKSIGFIKEPQEENMKITKGQLRQIIREEIGRMDNDLDTNDDGMISVGELEAEIEDIKDDLEMESFEVLLFKRRGKKIETSRVYVDVNIAGHKDSRASKDAAKEVAEKEYPGTKAQFAEFEKVGGLDANL